MNARSGDFHHLPQQGHSVQSPYKVLCKIQQHNSRRHHRSFGMSRPLRSTRRAAALANERLSAISSKWLDMCCVMMIPHWIMRPSGWMLDDDAESMLIWYYTVSSSSIGDTVNTVFSCESYRLFYYYCLPAESFRQSLPAGACGRLWIRIVLSLWVHHYTKWYALLNRLFVAVLLVVSLWYFLSCKFIRRAGFGTISIHYTIHEGMELSILANFRCRGWFGDRWYCIR